MASRYTDAERTDAVATYVEHGLAEAHRRTGIPKPTLKEWATKAGIEPSDIASRSAEKTRAATEAHRLAMAEARTRAQAEFARSAVHAAIQVRSCEKGNDAQGWATASAICLDKLRLELGEVTDRTERVAAPERTPEQEAELDRTLRLVQDRAA